ncbi:hypothetical protein BGW38_007567 [Lunasporangiospora selenospora]|uniref:Uncharacterized protein n=1 Tax=Lunasporangiospora selenospora TaxID=979761 RepID=A0A9P6KGJ5_9FUNG|nr:hypothetical protein BGW38_007567 [Lunasporangiospora selenospora]
MRIKPEIGDTVPRTLISNPTLAVQPSASTLAGQVRSSTQQPLDAAQSLQPKEAFKLVDDGSSSETKIATRRYFVMRCKGNALEEAMTQSILGLKSYEIHCRHGQEIVQAAGQHVLQLLAEMAPETSSVISSATTGAVSLSGHNSTPTISYSRNTPVQSNSRPSAAPTLVPQKRALSPTLGFELDTTGQRPISLKPRPQDIVSPAVMFEMHDNDFKMEASPELVPPPSAPKTNTTPMRFSLVPAELSKTQRKKQRKLARMAPLSFPKPKV